MFSSLCFLLSAQGLFLTCSSLAVYAMNSSKVISSWSMTNTQTKLTLEWLAALAQINVHFKCHLSKDMVFLKPAT